MASMATKVVSIGLLIMVMAEVGLAREYYAKCKVKKYKSCYKIWQTCPKSCPNYCEVDCVTCKPVCKCDTPGAVCQDPRFIGGDGITFYFHGQKERDFCLVSDSNLHINAHFIGKRNPTMKRDFTWVQSIGILFGSHRLVLGVQKTATWDDSVNRLYITVDSEPIFLPSEEGAKLHTNIAPIVTITRSRGANGIIVEADGLFKITANAVPITEEESTVHGYDLTKDDCLAHLDLGFKFYSLSSNVHGVLGQTYRNDYVSNVKMSAEMPIMGGDRNFVSSGLFATDCEVSRFGNLGQISPDASVYADLHCSSDMSGRGIVCKK